MVSINKAEKEAILAKYPNTHIVRTMVGDSRRHHYYCTEDKPVMRYLAKVRKQNVVEEHR